MFDAKSGELVFTHEELQRYMNKKYKYLGVKIKPFKGSVRIPVILGKK